MPETHTPHALKTPRRCPGRLLLMGLTLVLCMAAITACSPAEGSPQPAPGTPQARPTASQTSALAPAAPTPTRTPTPVPVPLAVKVNGEGITLAEFQEELKRFEAAQAQAGVKSSGEEGRTRVLDELIEETLLAQAAKKNGYTLDDAALKERIDRLAAQTGGPEKLAEWQARNGYSPESFRAALRRSAAAAWQRDQIIATVGDTAEQVRARQIVMPDATRADQIVSMLKNGGNFAQLAATYYDADTRGELGWFPRGYLTQPEVEKAAFSLQPGQYSPVIKTSFGYHIIQVIERDPKRQLSADARRTLQQQAMRAWLTENRTRSEIVILPING